MPQAQLAAWLQLHHHSGLRPPQLDTLIGKLGSAQAVCETPVSEWCNLLDKTPAMARHQWPQPSSTAVEAGLRWAETPGHHLLTWSDADYPAMLREIPDAPLLLYVVGEPAYLQRPQIALVGSRHATAGGRQTAVELATALVAAGLAVTSGLALGIDAAAHRGALQAGGVTLAVAGTGLDKTYPAQHRELAQAIATQGAVVSEFPLGAPPLREHFPRRNRIISGLSLGAVVVEAALRSGSLITARLATEQGREVFAVPGSIYSPLARGCHHLLRQGAKLVESVQDILEELRPLAAFCCAGLEGAVSAASPATPGGRVEQPESLSAPLAALLDCLGFDPITIDSVVDRSGLTPEVISSMLLELELQGLVESRPGGKYLRAQHGKRPVQ